MGVLTEDEQFTYDKLGNRESVNLRDGSDQDYVVNYSTNRYDNDAGEDIVCDYDDAGNTTEDPNGYQYIYDYENRLTLISHQVLSPHSWCDVRQHLIMESFILIYYNLF